MALFDLRCKTCGNEFQKMVPFSKLKETGCPDCGSVDHERIYKANIKGPVRGGGAASAPSAPSAGFT
ncbi:FmdB family zinc ribbon protein [Bacillus marinisedimentorum]|uniref:FmdB family zinc ribbon protein n=1 Tax=Bacillus marinisedimentorum TaxID=1821260 RepID=UPI000872A3F4|nr:FmdB family zinc ribbon protein [Bacillus marinisedimentorum]